MARHPFGPLLILMAFLVVLVYSCSRGAAAAEPAADLYGRVYQYLWPSRNVPLPKYGPPRAPAVMARGIMLPIALSPPDTIAPAVSPPAAIGSQAPAVPIIIPKSIVVPERPRQKRVERVDRTERVRVAGLPPCSVIRREYKRMTYAQSMAAYMAATPAQVAHGRACLGM